MQRRRGRNKVPSIYTARFYVRDGGLLSYGPDFGDIFRRAAPYFGMALNIKTAKALGLTIPETLLATAYEVIE